MIRADRRDSSHAGGSRGTYTHCIEPSCCSRVNRRIQPRRVHGVDACEVTSNPQRAPAVHPSFQLTPLPCAQSRIYRSPIPTDASVSDLSPTICVLHPVHVSSAVLAGTSARGSCFKQALKGPDVSTRRASSEMQSDWHAPMVISPWPNSSQAMVTPRKCRIPYYYTTYEQASPNHCQHCFTQP